MKLQQTTWILIAFTLLLGGTTYIYVVREETQEKQQQQQDPLFNFTQEEIQTLILEKDEEILEFEQSADVPNWQMKRPEKVTASDASLDFLVNLLVREKIRSTISLDADNTQDYGFKNPFATLTIQLETEEEYKLILGRNSFDNQSIYAQYSSPSTSEEEKKIILLSIDFRYAVERDLADWKEEKIEAIDSSEEDNLESEYDN